MVHPKEDTQAKMGFSPGIAEKIVLGAFRSFPYKACPPSQGANLQDPKILPTPANVNPPTHTDPPPIPVQTQNQPSNTRPISAQAKKKPSGPSCPPKSLNQQTEGCKDEPLDSEVKIEATGAEEAEALGPVGPPKSDAQIRYTEEGLQVPVGNGGVTDKYYWTQTLTELSVYVDVPPGTSSKDLEVSIRHSNLRIKLKKDAEPLIEGEFPYTVSSDSMWTLEDQESLVITLEKVVQTWWRSVLKGDPEIDATKVDSTTRVEDYDQETQKTIRKIMFDQKQKAMGLPTSDEMKMADILEEAKYAKGSPFLPGGAYEGQDLNFSL